MLTETDRTNLRARLKAEPQLSGDDRAKLLELLDEQLGDVDRANLLALLNSDRLALRGNEALVVAKLIWKLSGGGAGLPLTNGAQPVAAPQALTPAALGRVGVAPASNGMQRQ